MASIELAIRSPPGSQSAALIPQKGNKRGGCNCCLITLMIAVLLAVEAVLIFFLIPRDPCIYMKSGNADVSSFTAAPPGFIVGVDVDLTWNNPSYVQMGFREMKLNIYHACCTDPIGAASSLPDVDVGARSSQDVTVTINMDSSQMSGSGTCASELATQDRCLLTFKGTVVPKYMGYALPEVPIEFQQFITR